ncbi:hypothetical protein [Salinicoccus albus]|uniref:hypothetical protein n=1 Tax=Salinicoccus albus TaxID=418756 RepID=UPI00036BBF5B|nr:hypothetical protein [Salinicoccus albus]
MDRKHIKNKLTDVGMYIRRNTSILFYIFIALVVIAYGSLYTYKTYFQTEASTIPKEEKYKEFTLNNNKIQMVENEYNSESEFYVAKFMIKERNSDTPVIANESLEVSGIAQLNDNDLQELNIEAKQITPTFFVIEVDNLPKDHVELRLDFNLNNISLSNESSTEDASLYSFITEEEKSSELSSLSNEEYKAQSFEYEIDMVKDQIESLEEEIEYYNEKIATLKEQIEKNESEMDLMTDNEKRDMESTISSHKSEIETYEEEIESVKESIAEREEKLSILKSNI